MLINFKMRDEEILEIVNLELKKRKSLIPNYSLRKFASFLGISPASLSQILTRKRKLGPDVRSRIIQKLGLKDQREKLEYQFVDLEDIQNTSSWHCDAILELLKCKGFKGSPEWISKKLNISPQAASSAWEYLKKKQFVILSSFGYWIDNTSGHTSHYKSGVTSFLKRNYQEELLLKSRKSLLEKDISKREHSSLMVSIKRENYKKACVLLKKFRRQFATLLDEKNNADDVYQLCLSFFPLSEEGI